MRHLAANYIFTGKYFLKNAYITINDEGKILDVSDEGKGVKERERMIFYNGIIAPAFINSHCHLELAGFKDKTSLGKGLTEFIKSVANLSKDSKNYDTESIRNADEEMYLNGIQIVLDTMNSGASVLTKSKSSISYINFFEVFGVKPNDVKNRIKNAKYLISILRENNLPAYMTVHSPYSINKQLYDYVISENNEFLSLHFLESIEEFQSYTNQDGNLYRHIKILTPDYKPVINSEKGIEAFLEELIKTVRKVILVHNVSTKQSRIFSNDNVYLCLSPNSNLNISNNLPSENLLKSDSNFIIGTDSLASNNKLCVLEELKCLMRHYTDLKLEYLLKWATYNGAKAAGVENKYGLLSKNYSPGIILIEDLDLHNLKLNDNTTVKRLY